MGRTAARRVAQTVMTTPQDGGIRRSTHNAADPDAPATTRTAGGGPLSENDAPAPVPEDNLPGHHPEAEQDKPRTQ